MTIILKGGYYEHTLICNSQGEKVGEFREWRGPGSVIMRSAGEFHWLELDDEKPVTTLFFMGPQQREWGFLTETKTGKNRWVKNDHYLEHWKPYHEKNIVPKMSNRKVK
jgi:hypothetical protein